MRSSISGAQDLQVVPSVLRGAKPFPGFVHRSKRPDMEILDLSNIDRLRSVLMRFILMFVVLLGTVNGASAQTRPPLIIPRVAGPVTLDGISTEAAWDSVAPWIPVQYEPNNGAPATERTEFLVAYDDEYVYFALRAFDSDPNGLRANTLYRDRLSGDDHFEILLDTFNDSETALLFTTTPAGIRKDAAISNDASGGGDLYRRLDKRRFQHVLGCSHDY